MSKEITYSLSYPVILTRACSNACGYCGYGGGEPSRLPPPRVIRRHLREAARRGATQIELIAGEDIATNPTVVEAVRYYGFESYQNYLLRILQMIEATNSRSHLFSLLNVGPLSLAELRVLRPYLCAVRIMLESADAGLEFREAHREAPGKSPEARLEALLRCGRVGVPLTTGLLVGIGEKPDSYARAFRIIAEAHERYGHIQTVRIQMFHPVPGTLMEHFPEPSDEAFLAVIRQAREALAPEIAIQVSADEHPHLLSALLTAGVTDFGDLSVRRPPRNVSIKDLLTILAVETHLRGLRLAQRFPVHGRYCSPQWYPSGFPNRIPRAKACLKELSK
jgi:FO synthase subunit 1